MNNEIRVSILLFCCAAGLYACNNKAVTETTHVLPIQVIRNNQNLLDVRDVPFVNYPHYDNFSICHGNTCRYITALSLNGHEWGQVRELFAGNLSAQGEREQIRRAVALLETMVGNKTPTGGDRAENRAAGDITGELDCVDEATNTSVYISMLHADGLLRWHRPAHRSSRGISSLQFPHFTAVIRDTQSGVFYAVDSWFLDNGEPPFVLPLDEWRRGWRPDPVTTAEP